MVQVKIKIVIVFLFYGGGVSFSQGKTNELFANDSISTYRLVKDSIEFSDYDSLFSIVFDIESKSVFTEKPRNPVLFQDQRMVRISKLISESFIEPNQSHVFLDEYSLPQLNMKITDTCEKMTISLGGYGKTLSWYNQFGSLQFSIEVNRGLYEEKLYQDGKIIKKIVICGEKGFLHYYDSEGRVYIDLTLEVDGVSKIGTFYNYSSGSEETIVW